MRKNSNGFTAKTSLERSLFPETLDAIIGYFGSKQSSHIFSTAMSYFRYVEMSKRFYAFPVRIH